MHRHVARVAALAIVVLGITHACGLGRASSATAASDSIVTVSFNAPNDPPDKVLTYDVVDENSERLDQHITMSGSGTFHTGSYSGMSMKQLLYVAGVDPDRLLGMTLANAADQNPKVTLSKSEVLDGFSGNPNPDDPPDGQALIVGNRDSPTDRSSGFVFVRPMRGPGDDNQADSFVSSVGNSGPRRGIDVTFDVSGGVLAVDTPVAMPVQPKAKQTVQFYIPHVTTLPDHGPATGLSYEWTFGDDIATDTRARPNHTYASDGRWNVRVIVTDSLGNAGSAQVAVQVGTPDPDPEAPPGPPASGGPNPTGGGIAPKDATSTGKRQRKKASDLRQAEPTTPAAATGSGPGSGSGSGSGSGGAGGSLGAATGGGTASALGSSTRAPGASQASKRPARSPTVTTPTRRGLTGVVIDDQTAATLSAAQRASEKAAAEVAGARGSRGDAPANSWWEWLAQGAGVALLIGLGGLLEFRPRASYRRLLTS